jgi:hypothetical protein
MVTICKIIWNKGRDYNYAKTDAVLFLMDITDLFCSSFLTSTVCLKTFPGAIVPGGN